MADDFVVDGPVLDLDEKEKAGVVAGDVASAKLAFVLDYVVVFAAAAEAADELYGESGISDGLVGVYVERVGVGAGSTTPVEVQYVAEDELSVSDCSIHYLTLVQLGDVH